jgi:hypothetical protein
MGDRSTLKRLLAAFGTAALLCGSGISARADAITVYFKYNAIDSLSGNMITTVGSMTANPVSGTAYLVTALTGIRYDGAGVATLSLAGANSYGDTTDNNLINNNLLYLSALTPPIADTPPFDAHGITFTGSGTNGNGSSYLFDNLVYRTLAETGLYTTQPYFMVSSLGLYEDDYTAPIQGVGTNFVLNPILSFETSDTPLSAPAPVPGAGGFSFVAALGLLITAGARRVRGYGKARHASALC